ncbi:hypothetical protein GOODEAATRI_005071, partial [Goodea atripinnis]
MMIAVSPVQSFHFSFLLKGSGLFLHPPAVICFVTLLCGCKVEASHSCTSAWLQGPRSCRLQ